MMALLDFGRVIILERMIGNEYFYELKLPSKEIKVDLYPTIDMNNPEEIREMYKHIVDPLHSELEREEISFINARRIFMHPLHIQPGLLSEKRLEQFKNAYPASKSAINTTIQKYSIIEQQAKLMNDNIG